MPVMPWESLYSSMSFAIISGVGSPEGACDEDWDGADGSMVLAGVVGSSWFGAEASAGVISSMWPMIASILFQALIGNELNDDSGTSWC